MAALTGSKEGGQPGQKRKRGRPPKNSTAKQQGAAQAHNSDEEDFGTALVKKIKTEQEKVALQQNNTQQQNVASSVAKKHLQHPPQQPVPPPQQPQQESSEEEDDDEDDDDEDDDDDDEDDESETSDEDDDDDDDEDDDDDDDDESVETERSSDDAEWSKEDTDKLLGNIELQLSPDDNLRYSLGAERLDWKKIVFGEFTEGQCKKQWLFIIAKLRKYRTMTELVEDAKEISKNPPPAMSAHKKKKVTHPDMPKKPLTAYFRYFLAKRDKYSKKHTELSMTDLSKLLGEKYNKMEETKKQKYKDASNRAVGAYKLQMVKFRKEHPELFTAEGQLKTEEPKNIKTKEAMPKALTPQTLFISNKVEEHMKKAPGLLKKQCVELYREKWGKLSQNKKLKYIIRAYEAKKKLDSEMNQLMTEIPEETKKTLIAKSVLTKEEQRLKDRHDGKPLKPAPNGYGLYSSVMLPLLTDIVSVKRMAEVSKRWKILPESERLKYNQQATTKMAEYKVAHQKYLESLPDDEREKQLQMEKKPKKVTIVKEEKDKDVNERTKQPQSPLFVFINEKRDKYAKKHPNTDHQDLTRLMAKDYWALPDEKKNKYKKMLEQMKTPVKTEVRLPIELPPTSPAAAAAVVANNQAHPNARNKKKKKKYVFPGEPKKPPGSGYALFSTEMLVKLNEVPSNERMSVISQKWGTMTDKEKLEYKKTRNKLWAQYNKDLQKFRSKLTPEQTIEYDKYCEAQKPANKKKVAEEKAQPAKKPSQPARAAAKKKPAPPPVPEKKESSEEEESEEESGEESESEEEESGEESESEEEAEGATVNATTNNNNNKKAVQNGPTAAAAAQSSSEESESEDETESESAGSESD